ncbi:hypothetical protein BKA62DRAFT_667041 [Auriculariales sp. MPI-PUGE-AT-0066]|nr:hypothetical protein BKA62DRAFT_667041 [Auriculariales sp. MPI-PUGE-AT-0066]
MAVSIAPHAVSNLTVSAAPVILTSSSNSEDSPTEATQLVGAAMLVAAPLAAPFQPRAVSLSTGQLLLAKTTPVIPVALSRHHQQHPRIRAAAVPTLRPVGTANARHNVTRRSQGHSRSVSMPDAALAERERARSPTTQYNEAWDHLAQKYLCTPQLNNLEHHDSSPSPPSSPDSVLIIQDHVPTTRQGQLPKNFLRRRGNSLAVFDNLTAGERTVPHIFEDTTKANEQAWPKFEEPPPRPIPALHGPASLPYARCPSGAEGIIIEEQSQLPTVVWGLDGRDGEVNSVVAEAGSVSDFGPPPQHRPQTFRPQGQRFDKGGGNRNRNARMRGPRNAHQQPHPQQFVPRMPMLSHEDLLRATVRPVHAAQYGINYNVARNAPPPDMRRNVYSGPIDDIDEQILLARLRAEAASRMNRQTRAGAFGPPYIQQQNVKPNLIALLDVAQSHSEGTGYALKATPPTMTTPTFHSRGGFSPTEEQLRRAHAWASPNTPSSIGSMPSLDSIASLAALAGIDSVEASPSTAELSDQLRRLVLGPRGAGEDIAAGLQNVPRGAVSLPATPLMPNDDVVGQHSLGNYRSPGARVNSGGQLVSAWDIMQGRKKPIPASPNLGGGKKRDPTSPGTAGAGMARRLRVGPAAAAASSALAALTTVPEEPESGRALPVPIPTPSSPVAEKKGHRSNKSLTSASWRKHKIVDEQTHQADLDSKAITSPDIDQVQSVNNWSQPSTPVIQQDVQSRPVTSTVMESKRAKTTNANSTRRNSTAGRARKVAASAAAA